MAIFEVLSSMFPLTRQTSQDGFVTYELMDCKDKAFENDFRLLPVNFTQVGFHYHQFRNCSMKVTTRINGVESSGIGHHFHFRTTASNWGQRPTLSCPGGYLLVGEHCFVETSCTCNELKDTATNTCTPLAPSSEWDRLQQVVYEFPDNNHSDAPRCEPIPVPESDASCSKTSVGNPIDCATGQKHYTDLDYQGFGLDALSHRRQYYSPLVSEQNDDTDTAIGLQGGLNTYGYVGGNPLIYSDPFGLAGMVVIFNGYQVDTGMGFKLPLGHAGVVAIDDETGVASYYEFGRYGGEYGNVRGPINVGKLEPCDSCNGYTGAFTAESLKTLKNNIKGLYGDKWELTTVTNFNANGQKINDFAMSKIGNEDQYPYTLNPFSTNPLNYCYTFAFEALGAGL